MTGQEWLEYLVGGRARAESLLADLSAGVDEVVAAHRHGFATRHDVEADLIRRSRSEEPESQPHPTKGTTPCPSTT